MVRTIRKPNFLLFENRTLKKRTSKILVFKWVRILSPHCTLICMIGLNLGAITWVYSGLGGS